MYEVKVVIPDGNRRIPVTLATFERDETVDYSFGRAVAFAKQIKDFEVTVTNIERENVGPDYGLAYHRTPRL
jgi:hypothetical protein